MNFCEYNVEDLQNRILNLEKQNRKFKQIATAVLIIPSLLFVMGQKTVKKTIEANEFVIKDSGGKIRATISVDESLKASVAQLVLFDPNGHEKVRVDSGWQGLGGGTVVLSDENGQNASLMSNYLSISGDHNISGTTISRDGFYVTDSEGFEAALGVSPPLVTPRTGQTHKTSAAALVLFDKNKNVIWQVP